MRYIHKDGSICNKERRWQKERIDELESQLPDLPDLPGMNETEPTLSGLPEETSDSPVYRNQPNGLQVATGLSGEINGSNIHMNDTTTSNIVSPTDDSPNTPNTGDQTSLYAETDTTLNQQNLPPANVRDETHHVAEQTITPISAGTVLGSQPSNQPTLSLHEETNQTPTDVLDRSNADVNDMIDAAQGLLLLGTDVSSADDSQEPLELPLPVGLRDETDAKSNDIDKTVKADTIDTPTHPPNVTSPRKGVLNLRQIGIKRHQPVDSSHPSAIGSPPGSPNTVKPVRSKPMPRKNKASSKEITNTKLNHSGKNKRDTKRKQTNDNTIKDKPTKSERPQTSVSRSKPDKCRKKAPTQECINLVKYSYSCTQESRHLR